MESLALDIKHSLVVRLLNLEVHHLLPKSMALTIVKTYFLLSCQKITCKWEALSFTIVVHCVILPSHPTLWFDRMLSVNAMTFYTFSTRPRQLGMHSRSDSMGFQFTASSTSNLTTIK